MDIEISDEKLECINEVYETLGSIPIAAELAKEKISREFDIAEDDSWSNPIDTYDAKNYFNRTREKMIRFAVKQMCPVQRNFKIDADKVVEYIDALGKDEYFDVKTIQDYVKKEYIDKADELSFKEIKNNATRLLPTIWTDHERRNVEIADILTGGNKKNSARALKLHADVGWEYSFIDTNDFYDKVGAFEKMIDITISGALSSEARKGVISTIYQSVRCMPNADEKEKELLKRHYTGASHLVEWTKLFKNGRFDVKFRRHEDALKVGNALIDAQEPPIIY